MKDIKTNKVIKNYTNYFAQEVFELDNGTKIYIHYGRDVISVETPSEK